MTAVVSPTDIHPKTGKSTVETVLTVCTLAVSLAMVAIRSPAVCTAWAPLWLTRYQKTNRRSPPRRQVASPGIPARRAANQVEVVGKTDKTGTEISFWADGTIFQTTEFNYDTI